MIKNRLIDDEVLERPFNWKQFSRLLSYLKPYKSKLLLSLFLMITAALCSLSGPYFTKLAIDNYISPGKLEGIHWVILLFFLSNLISALCLRYRVKIMDTLGRSAIAKLREDLFDHIQSLSLSFFDSRPAGKIMVRVINDVNSLMGLFTDGIINVLIDCATIFVILGLMLSLNVKLTLISISTIPLLILIAFKLKRMILTRWQNVRRKSSNMNAYLHETLAGMRVTQAFVREKENARIQNELNEDIKTSWMKAVIVNHTFWPSLNVVSAIGKALVFFFGVRMIDTGAVTIGTLTAIISYLGRFWDPLNKLSNFYNQILIAMASTERIFEIMDTPPLIKDVPNAVDIPEIKGEVEFDNVTFGYDTDKIVLHNVSFRVNPGETIALVGPTGAGKSTVVNLISRFYDTTSGEVRIDGYNVKDVTLKSLRKQMGVMLQDSFIFSGTIMDNIRYGKIDATEEEIIACAKAVHAHDFIVQMENGYYTEVNERGSRLSIGQKQLISFARALLANPRILILDEATSSIDTHTELLIQKAIETVLSGRTSFVIAHRLSTIRKADRIMVVDNGQIAECGNHYELLKAKGIYYNLCKSQYRFLDAV
jgi:ATP-binding cassette subfamily B multidrug efflux pump